MLLRLWDAIKAGYLRVIAPVGDFLVARRVSPNHITTVGTLCAIVAGAIFAAGHIRAGGLFLGITALFDVLDGTVARRTGRTSTFGAFYDSTLDRVADGALLGGLAWFYAVDPVHHNEILLGIALAGLVGTFMVSYTRARAESLGIDAKVGFMQRPERIALLAAPQGIFGLALDGWLLAGIVTLLAVSAWITAVQRIQFVHTATTAADEAERAATPASPPVIAADPSLADAAARAAVSR